MLKKITVQTIIAMLAKAWKYHNPQKALVNSVRVLWARVREIVRIPIYEIDKEQKTIKNWVVLFTLE